MKSKIGQGHDAFLMRLHDWRNKKRQWEGIFSFKSIPDEKTLSELEASWDDILRFTQAISEMDPYTHGGRPGVIDVVALQQEGQLFLNSAIAFLNGKVKTTPNAFIIQEVKTWQAQKNMWEKIFSLESNLNQEERLKLVKSWDGFLGMSQTILQSSSNNSKINLKPLKQEAIDFIEKAANFFKEEFNKGEPAKTSLPVQASLEQLEKWKEQKEQWENIFALKLPDLETRSMLISSWDEFIAMTIARSSTPLNDIQAINFLKKSANFFFQEFNEVEAAKTEIPKREMVERSIVQLAEWQERPDVKKWGEIFSQKSIPDEVTWINQSQTWPDLLNSMVKILPNGVLTPINSALQKEVIDFLQKACVFFGIDFSKNEGILVKLPQIKFFERTNIIVDSLQEWSKQAKEWEEIFQSDKIDNQKWLSLIKNWHRFIEITQKLSNLGQMLHKDGIDGTLALYQAQADKILVKVKEFFDAEVTELTGIGRNGLPLQENLKLISLEQLEIWREQKKIWERVFASDFPSERDWLALVKDWGIFKSITQAISRKQFGPVPSGVSNRASLKAEADNLLKNANNFFNSGSTSLPPMEYLPNDSTVGLLHKWQKQKKMWVELFSLKKLLSENELRALSKNWENFIQLSQQIASLPVGQLRFNTVPLQQNAKQFLEDTYSFFKGKLDKEELTSSSLLSSSRLKAVVLQRVEELTDWQEQKKQWEAIFSYDLILDEKIWEGLMSSWERVLDLAKKMESPQSSMTPHLQKEDREFLEKAARFFNSKLEKLPPSADLKVFSIEQFNWQVQVKQWQEIFDSKPPSVRSCYDLLGRWDEFMKMTQEVISSQHQFAKKAEQFLINAAKFFNIILNADSPALPSQSELVIKKELSKVNGQIKNLLVIATSTENNSKTFKKLIATKQKIQDEYEELKKIPLDSSDNRVEQRKILLNTASSSIGKEIEKAKEACRTNFLDPIIDKDSRRERDNSIKLKCRREVDIIIDKTAKDLAKLEVDLEIYTQNTRRAPLGSSEILDTAARKLEGVIEREQEQHIKNRWSNINQPPESQTLANNTLRCKAAFTEAYKEILRSDPFFSKLNEIQRRIENEWKAIAETNPPSEDKTIRVLQQTHSKIQKEIDNAITRCANKRWENPETLEESKIKNDCKTAIAKTIKIDLIDNKVLDFSWREKFCRFIYNIVVKIGITPRSENPPALVEQIYKDKVAPTFFKETTTKVHKAVEEIYKEMDKINITPQK